MYICEPQACNAQQGPEKNKPIFKEEKKDFQDKKENTGVWCQYRFQSEHMQCQELSKLFEQTMLYELCYSQPCGWESIL